MEVGESHYVPSMVIMRFADQESKRAQDKDLRVFGRAALLPAPYTHFDEHQLKARSSSAVGAASM